jgi:hypothetical protein
MSIDSVVRSTNKGFLVAEQQFDKAVITLSDIPTMAVTVGGFLLGAGIGAYMQGQASPRSVVVGTALGVTMGAANAIAVKAMAYVHSLNNARFERVYHSTNE